MRRILALALVAVAAALGYAGWLGFRIWEQSRHDEVRRADAIVVLGAAQYDGRPSPVFKARLDHAAYLYDEDLAQTVVVTGGKRKGDRFSEAEAGRRYLEQQGLPSQVILSQAEGETTYESLREVGEIAEDEGIDSVLLVSDPLHSERIKEIAKDVGFDEAYASWTSYSELQRSRRTKLAELMREIASLAAYELLDR